MADMNDLYKTLNDLLSTVKLDDVTSESNDSFDNLPDGYYLAEVEKAELKESKTSHQPMIAMQFKVVEEGLDVSVNAVGEVSLKSIEKTKNRKIFMYWVLKDEKSVKRFASDMLKFEDDDGESILPKEAFMRSETIEDSIELLQGMRIYVHISTTSNDDGSTSTWSNLITWKRAKILELPV